MDFFLQTHSSTNFVVFALSRLYFKTRPGTCRTEDSYHRGQICTVFFLMMQEVNKRLSGDKAGSSATSVYGVRCFCVLLIKRGCCDCFLYYVLVCYFSVYSRIQEAIKMNFLSIDEVREIIKRSRTWKTLQTLDFIETFFLFDIYHNANWVILCHITCLEYWSSFRVDKVIYCSYWILNFINVILSVGYPVRFVWRRIFSCK